MPKIGGSVHHGFQVSFDLRPSWWFPRSGIKDMERMGRAMAAVCRAIDWGPSEVVLRATDLFLTMPIPRGGLYSWHQEGNANGFASS